MKHTSIQNERGAGGKPIAFGEGGCVCGRKGVGGGGRGCVMGVGGRGRV